MIVKINKQDLIKLAQELEKDTNVHTVGVTLEPLKISFTLHDGLDGLTIVTLFDATVRSSPKITRTESL